MHDNSGVRRVGGGGIKQKKKKNSWTLTTVWSLCGGWVEVEEVFGVKMVMEKYNKAVQIQEIKINLIKNVCIFPPGIVKHWKHLLGDSHFRYYQ